MSNEGLKLENDLCRCCQAEGRFKSLSESPRGEESFTEMLKIVLDIELQPVSDPLDRKMFAICDICIRRLEDADNFKQQVLGCEKVFQQLYAGDLIKVAIEEPAKKIITIKDESDSDEDYTLRDDVIHIQLKSGDEETDKNQTQTLLVEIPPIPYDVEETEIRQSKSMLHTILTEPLRKTERKTKAAPKQAAPTGKKRKAKAKPKTLDEKIKQAMERQEKKKEKRPSKKAIVNADGETSQVFRLPESDYTIDEGKPKCVKCDKVFKNMYGIQKHFKSTHMGMRQKFKCKICSEPCKNQTQLAYHKIEIHNIDDRFKCNACEKAFARKIDLKLHMENFHKLGVIIKCKFCDHEAYTQMRMRRHMEKHKTVKNFQCRYCNKTFLRRNTLNFHERIHTGDRRKVCKECGQAFVQKASLNYHMAKNHPGVPF